MPAVWIEPGIWHANSQTLMNMNSGTRQKMCVKETTVPYDMRKNAVATREQKSERMMPHTLPTQILRCLMEKLS
jgi:hypothetical protein